jgi:hypothetical protein
VLPRNGVLCQQGVRTERVRRLSEFDGGKVKSETVKNVNSVIGRSGVMFEHFKIKGSRKTAQSMDVFLKSGSKERQITENNLIIQHTSVIRRFINVTRNPN